MHLGLLWAKILKTVYFGGFGWRISLSHPSNAGGDEVQADYNEDAEADEVSMNDRPRGCVNVFCTQQFSNFV